MKIDVKELSKVDKEINITAGQDDLQPLFDKAIKDYRKKMTMPGFRQGQVPVGIVKKRFGKEIEGEQINQYIQDVFKAEIVEAHKPIGEPQVSTLTYEEGVLNVTMRIGVKPDFELVDLATITVDRMEHDVVEEEIDEELQRMQKRFAEWSETDGKAGEASKVAVDAQLLDADGKPVEGDLDENKELELSKEENAPFLIALKGKKAGDTVKVKLDKEDAEEAFEVTLKKVLESKLPEINDEFVATATQNTYTDISNYRSYLKSQIQDYYDQTANDMAKQSVMDAVIEKHDFEVPQVIIDSYIESLARQTFENEGVKEVPADFNFEDFKNENIERTRKDARWAFILNALEEKYQVEVELTPADVDNHLAAEAARYGLPVEMVKNFYAQSGDQLENLRRNIKTDKLFKKLLEVVTINGMTKKEYQDKYNKSK